MSSFFRRRHRANVKNWNKKPNENPKTGIVQINLDIRLGWATLSAFPAVSFRVVTGRWRRRREKKSSTISNCIGYEPRTRKQILRWFGILRAQKYYLFSPINEIAVCLGEQFDRAPSPRPLLASRSLSPTLTCWQFARQRESFAAPKWTE